jgi:hypothetical protein
MTMYAINFYSEIYEHMLRSGRKCGTIRLGDKSLKYRRGEVVWITVGQRFGRRRKLFAAIIDSVTTKPLHELSPHEISYENPEFRSVEEVASILATIYDRFIADDEVITILRFSPIDEG